jgi:hypothetical protein
VVLAPALYHLDGDPDPAPGSQNNAVSAPTRQSDAALAKPLTTFLCGKYCTIKFKKLNILIRLIVALALHLIILMGIGHQQQISVCYKYI